MEKDFLSIVNNRINGKDFYFGNKNLGIGSIMRRGKEEKCDLVKCFDRLCSEKTSAWKLFWCKSYSLKLMKN